MRHINHKRVLYVALTAHDVTIMEQAGEDLNNGSELTGNEPIHARLDAVNARTSKRIKELENVALQTTLTSVEMESEAAGDCGGRSRGQEESKESDGHLNGLSYDETGAPLETGDASSQVYAQLDVNKDQVEERTLTDHLNKRLLSSFLEKLNQRDLSLPGIQRLDCAVADEDSNRAVDEW